MNNIVMNNPRIGISIFWRIGGTKRLFDLIDMLMTKRQDMVFPDINFTFLPIRPDLQFSLHKTMLWLMVAKLATIKSRNSFMYIVAPYGNKWYMYLTDASWISRGEGKFWLLKQQFCESTYECPQSSKAPDRLTKRYPIGVNFGL